MKLSEVIKSKNGLAFLGQNVHLIQEHANRLSDDVPYDEKVDYGENEFSYKEYVRKFPKEFGTEFVEVIRNVKNHHIRNTLLGKVIPFDGDHISIEKDHSVSFQPYNKVVGKGRQEMSVYKFLNKVFKNDTNVSEHQIKQAGDQICAANSEYFVEFINGYSIAQHYRDIDCDEWETTSCMSGQDTDWFQIYVDNPEVCSLGLIKLKDSNDIVGRFLRWETSCGNTVADRLYYERGVVDEWFKDWCNAEGLYRRCDDELSNFEYEKEEQFRVEFTVNLKYDVDGYTNLPYFDTFRYTDGNSTINNISGCHTLECSTGEGINRVFDEIDECYIDEEDAVYVEYGDTVRNRGDFWTHVDNTVEIDYGDGKGYRALQDDCIYSETNNAYMLN